MPQTGRDDYTLYLTLASCPEVLDSDGRDLLQRLTTQFLGEPQPHDIPVPENKAVINAVRWTEGYEPLAIETVTDVLRLASVPAGIDLRRATSLRLRRPNRADRRTLMAILETVVVDNPVVLCDVWEHARHWSALAGRIGPHETRGAKRSEIRFEEYPHARDVFTMAVRPRKVQTAAARIEVARHRGLDIRLRTGEATQVLRLLSPSPDALTVWVPAILRICPPDDVEDVLAAFDAVLDLVGRAALGSLREEVAGGKKPLLPATAADGLLALVDSELERRGAADTVCL